MEPIQIIYIRRSLTKARFFLSTDSSRNGAREYFSASLFRPEQGRLCVTTSSAYGDTTCLLSSEKDRIFGYSPLHGEMILNNNRLGTVDIVCDKNRPPIEVKTDSSRIVLENAFLAGTYPHFKTEELGYLVEISKGELSFKDLWDSRFGFGLITWGALLPNADGLTAQLTPALHIALAAYEFVVDDRRGGVSTID